MRQNVPILVYHHVYKDSFLESINTKHESAPGMIKESEFRLHLNYIFENNWSVISTNQLSDWIEGKVEIPEKASQRNRIIRTSERLVTLVYFNYMFN